MVYVARFDRLSLGGREGEGGKLAIFGWVLERVFRRVGR